MLESTEIWLLIYMFYSIFMTVICLKQKKLYELLECLEKCDSSLISNQIEKLENLEGLIKIKDKMIKNYIEKESIYKEILDEQKHEIFYLKKKLEKSGVT